MAACPQQPLCLLDAALEVTHGVHLAEVDPDVHGRLGDVRRPACDDHGRPPQPRRFHRLDEVVGNGRVDVRDAPRPSRDSSEMVLPPCWGAVAGITSPEGIQKLSAAARTVVQAGDAFERVMRSAASPRLGLHHRHVTVVAVTSSDRRYRPTRCSLWNRPVTSTGLASGHGRRPNENTRIARVPSLRSNV
jgi:hypothetical protein